MELEALDRNQKPIQDGVSWTNAQKSGTRGIVDLRTTDSQEVTLTQGENTMTVTVRRFDGEQDIKDLIKEILISALTTKKEEAMEELPGLRSDSTKNANDLTAQLKLIESQNYPLQEGNDALVSLYDELQTQQDTTDFKDSNNAKAKGFKFLRRRKAVQNNIRRRVNVVAFVDLLVEKPEKLTELLDDVLRNSGRLLAKLIVGRDKSGARDEARDIVVEYLNDNLERLANSNFGYQTEIEIPSTPVYEPPVLPTPTFDPNNPLFVSELIDFEGRQELIDQIKAFQAAQDTPTFVTVNYSQDLSIEAFRNRAKYGRAKGIPANYKHISIWYVNVPGSVKYSVESTDGSVLNRISYAEISFDNNGIDITSLFGSEVSYVTPGGTIITLPSNSKAVFTGSTSVERLNRSLPSGVLLGFVNEAGRYVSRYTLVNGEYVFKEYVNISSDDPFPVAFPSQGPGNLSTQVLIGIENFEGCKITLQTVQYEGKKYEKDAREPIIPSIGGSPSNVENGEITLDESKCEAKYLTEVVFNSQMQWSNDTRGFTGSITIDDLKTNTSNPDLRSQEGKNIRVADYVGLEGKSIGLKSDSEIGSIFLELASTIKVCITNDRTESSIISALRDRQSIGDFGDFISLSSDEMLLWVHFTDENESKVIFWFPSTARQGVRDYLKAHSPIGIAQMGIAEAGVFLKTYGDLVSKAIEGVMIPEEYWNPQHGSYKPYMGYVSAAVFASVTDIALLSYQDLTNTERSETLSQRKFALACGIYNGVLTEVKAIPEMVSMIGELMSSGEFREQIAKGIENATFSSVWNSVSGSAVEHFNTLADLTCVSAEQLGKDIVFVASFFVGLGEISIAVKGAKGAKEVFSGLARIVKANARAYANTIWTLAKLPKNVYRFVQSGTKKLLYRKSDDVLLATIDEASGLAVNKWGFASRNVDGSIVKKSEDMLDVDGRTVHLTEGSDGKSVFCDRYGACFVKGTLIATALGLMPIEDIKAGDQVWAYDEIHKVQKLKDVTRTFKRQSHRLIDLLVNKERIKTTPEHPFYSNEEWIPAGNLKKGAELTTLDPNRGYTQTASIGGDLLPMTRNLYARSSLEVEDISLRDTLVTVYNFEVADFHTYFVGSSQILVHNTCVPDNLKEVYDGLDEVVKTNHLSKLEPDDLTALLSDIKDPSSSLTAKFFNDNPSSVDSWKVLADANIDDALRRDADFLRRFTDAEIPETSLTHANRGDFTQDPRTGNYSRMKGGGHGQENIDFLEANDFEYNVVKEYENGVRIGNVPAHKTARKRTGTGQSWFPGSWDVNEISDAGKYVSSLPDNVNAADGAAVFGDYKGVRVGVIKTDGKVATIFPDEIQSSRVIREVADISSLYGSLSTTLKKTYDDLLSQGLKATNVGNIIKFTDDAGNELASIINDELVPSKWTAYFKGEIVATTETGHWLIKSGDEFGFDLGYKNGRELTSEQVNTYHRGIGNHSPYKPLNKVYERDLQVGDKIYIVEYKFPRGSTETAPNPGGWGSKNKISTIKQLREDLAVLEGWKDASKSGGLVVREYTVKKALPVRDGVVGPLQEVGDVATAPIYRGGEQQYEFMKYLGGDGWKEYLDVADVVGEALK